MFIWLFYVSYDCLLVAVFIKFLSSSYSATTCRCCYKDPLYHEEYSSRGSLSQKIDSDGIDNRRRSPHFLCFQTRIHYLPKWDRIRKYINPPIINIATPISTRPPKPPWLSNNEAPKHSIISIPLKLLIM